MLSFSLIVTYHLPAFIIVSDPDSKQGAPSGCKVGGAATVLSTGGGGGESLKWFGSAWLQPGWGQFAPSPYVHLSRKDLLQLRNNEHTP